MRVQILAVDRAWTPDRWLDWDDVINLYSRGLVDMSIGEPCKVLRGGTNAKTGKQSVLEIGSILVTDTRGRMADYSWVPTLTNSKLFARDRHICAYCGDRFRDKDLTLEHIQPESRGGQTVWTNVVAACKPCNQRKADRTPTEARMELLYVPYTPNRYEGFILDNRNILQDQMLFLSAKVPKHSRILS